MKKRTLALCRALSLIVLALGLAAGCSTLLPRRQPKTVIPLKLERLAEAGLSLLWKADLPWGEKVRDSYLLGERLYVVTSKNRLYAFDAQTGSNPWIFQADGTIYGRAATDDKDLFLIVGRDILAINPDEGFKDWEISLDFPPASALAVDEFNIYLGGYDGKCYAIDKRTRFEKWHFTPGGHITGGPTLLADTVYFGDSEGRVLALSILDGRQRFRYHAGAAIRDPLARIADRIYVRAENYQVYSLNSSWQGLERRQPAWIFPAGGSVELPPAAVADTVYIAAEGVGVFAADMATGERKWFVPGARQFLFLGKESAYLLGANGMIQVVSKADGGNRLRLDARRFDQFVTNTSTDVLYMIRSGDGILAAREAQFRE